MIKKFKYQISNIKCQILILVAVFAIMLALIVPAEIWAKPAGTPPPALPDCNSGIECSGDCISSTTCSASPITGSQDQCFYTLIGSSDRCNRTSTVNQSCTLPANCIAPDSCDAGACIATPLGATSCGTGTVRATGLVSTPRMIVGTKFNTTGACIIDPKAAFAPYKLPTFEDLKSLYFDQAKSSGGITKHDSLTGDKTQGDIPMTAGTDHLYNIKKTNSASTDGNLTITGNIPGERTGVVFVEGDLIINPTSGSLLTDFGRHRDTGLVFIVKGNIIIDKSVTRIYAVLIASGFIYTAGDGTAKTGCDTSSITTTDNLIVNGSFISLDPNKPIKFCRKLTDNRYMAAESIHQAPKYLVILNNLFADTVQKWSEIQ